MDALIKSLTNWHDLYKASGNEKYRRQYLVRCGEVADHISQHVQEELAPWRENSETSETH